MAKENTEKSRQIYILLQRPKGKFTSTPCEKLERVVCNTSKKFNTEKKYPTFYTL